ncbi:hypothetical protein BDP81DRAFT_140782 [Colletotrichum phormii]|uniref:Uncharacterized protein n=1 Tax=Colletotrichum phormii TaxID=359342 RepID=A0AAI9ZGF4_9PEZI|nr:uncharacterized protein BDP81DRAFT_140782 [Colletotrichum phormii]KAK1622899.1 hypothetical protein BDP81DRAFT_140782 [Colletotrichum phormii]
MGIECVLMMLLILDRRGRRRLCVGRGLRLHLHVMSLRAPGRDGRPGRFNERLNFLEKFKCSEGGRDFGKAGVEVEGQVPQDRPRMELLWKQRQRLPCCPCCFFRRASLLLLAILPRVFCFSSRFKAMLTPSHSLLQGTYGVQSSQSSFHPHISGRTREQHLLTWT